MARYIPHLQRFEDKPGTLPRKSYASQTYSDLKNLEFIIESTPNTFSNYSTMCVALTLQFTNNTTKTAQLDNEMITVNNFSEHWFKDIDIGRYPDDTRILPTKKSVDVYQYLAQQLKYLPEKSLEIVQKTFLYKKPPVYLTGNRDRRSATSATDADRTDNNLNERINAFKD